MEKLPYCNYPNAAGIHYHGLQKLPATLPPISMEAAKPFRSKIYKAIVIDKFNDQQVLQVARMIANSFAMREPMARHIQPPKNPPADIQKVVHRDPFGIDLFGDWSKENILWWVTRLFVLTDPCSPIDSIKMNTIIRALSVAVQDMDGRVIGGALSLPAYPGHSEQGIRQSDPFLDAVYAWFRPIHNLLITQDKVALNHLCEHYKDFEIALQSGRVVIFFMVARSNHLPSEDSFELIAASLERFKELGYEFVVTSAANQWTGAAFELLNAVRVHFAPYRLEKKLKVSKDAPDDEVSSADGYLSAKDSGCMFYVLQMTS